MIDCRYVAKIPRNITLFCVQHVKAKCLSWIAVLSALFLQLTVQMLPNVLQLSESLSLALRRSYFIHNDFFDVSYTQPRLVQEKL